MKYKQEKIKKKAYDMINKITNEFDLSVSHYPEIHWIGKRTFKSFGLTKIYRPDFKKIKEEKSSMYLYEKKMILVGGDIDGKIAEEAGHFLHFENSGIDLINTSMENPIDYCSLKIIIEAIGFFCSKLIDPRREKLYGKDESFRDFIRQELKEKGIKYKNLDEKILEKAGDSDPFFIYKHGYDLGEELFNRYISENINKLEIRNLFKNPFKEDFSATKKLLYFKDKFN